MKTDLTPAQIAQYQDEGSLIVEEFLPPDELAKLSDAVEAGVHAGEVFPRLILHHPDAHQKPAP